MAAEITNVVPTAHYISVELETPEELNSIIKLSDDQEFRLWENTTVGTIRAIGEMAFLKEEHVFGKKPDYKVGDRVIFMRYSGQTCTITAGPEKDKRIRVVRDIDLIGKVS